MARESKSAVGVRDPRSNGRQPVPERKPGVNERVDRSASAVSRLLVGTTILQIVPALRDDVVARSAVEAARTLRQFGARAMIAGAGGPLVEALTAAGAEWIALPADTVSPLRLRSNARAIEQLIGVERVDIVHAHGAGPSRSAHIAAERSAVRFVTSLPDQPPI